MVYHKTQTVYATKAEELTKKNGDNPTWKKDLIKNARIATLND